MVGVPGRSKGCHTCRRRKIKCDLAKPNCERCTRSGRECEGYARGAVFLNRTPQGMLKREHLDEAEPRDKRQSSASTADSPPSSDSRPSSLVPREAAFTSGEEHPQEAPILDVHAGITDRKVLTSGLEAYYVSRFVPLESRRGSDTCGIWSLKALDMANRGEALDNAFAALAFNRAGRDQDDPSLVLQGREAYGRALRAVSKSLLDPWVARSDQLLAACNLLKTYEIQEATGDSTTGHDSHIAGLTKMIQQRGVEALRSEHNRYLVNEVRFSAMIVALQYRKRNPLGDPEWSPESWNSPSDILQDLYNKGFALSGLTEDIDIISKMSDVEMKTREALAISRKILSVHDELNAWHRDVLKKAELPLEWPNADSLPGARQYESPYDGYPTVPKIRFSLLYQRLVMMDFWTLRIAVCIILKTFEQDMAAAGTKRMGPERSLSDMMLQLTENIVDTAPLCLSNDCGLYGQARTIYALRVAILPARMIQTSRAESVRKRVEALIAIVSSKAARNVAAKSTISDKWKGHVYAQDHQFAKKT